MILEKVKGIIAKQIGVTVGELDPQANFAEDLGIDSLEIVEIVMSLEEEFNIEIPNEEVEGIKNTVDICKYIESKLA